MARLLLMLGLAGTAVTFLGSASLWFFNEHRRIRRALRRVLGDEAEAIIIAKGRGRGAGFSLASGLLAVTWDKGDWCLVYRLAEILGAELSIDGQIVARVHREDGRTTLQHRVSSADQVMLRLLFNDAAYPDFELDLWLAGDENRREEWSPRAAVQEGDRWLARIDALLRRAAPKTQVAAPPTRVAVSTPPLPSPPPPARAARPAPAQDRLPLDDDDDGPPWDDEDGDVRR